MDLTLLLVLPLVGGYAFSTIWTGSLYYASRESGHRLYFRAIFYAFFLIACAALIHINLFISETSYKDFLILVGEVISVENKTPLIWGDEAKTVIFIGAFILGPGLAVLLNFPKLFFLTNLQIPLTNIKPFLWWERTLLDFSIKNNDFEKLIARSAYSFIPILFTLKTGKVYVGWSVRAPNPVEARKAVRILPLLREPLIYSSIRS